MKRINIFLYILLFSLFITCGSKPSVPSGIREKSTDLEQITEVYTLTFLAAGDNLFHDSIIRTSAKGSSHDFTPIYSEVKSIVQKADLAFINQETVMAGEQFGYSGYPLFNTPQALAQNLADTGFNIINLANNHAMDMGEAGLLATLDHLDTIKEITVIGARKAGDKSPGDKSPDDLTPIHHKIITKNNITLGFLSYTFSLNGIPLPINNPNIVSMVNKNTMEKEIGILRPLCDFLIVSMHWGDEYKLVEPVQSQKDLALFLAAQNVDLIIGHHPHVLQRAEKLPRSDGKETLCFYSLGNFASAQRGKDRLLGALMLVTFVKESSPLSGDELYINDSGLLPVVCHYDRTFSNTKVYPLYSYNEELMKQHRNRIDEKDFTMEYYHSVMEKLGTTVIMQDPF